MAAGDSSFPCLFPSIVPALLLLTLLSFNQTGAGAASFVLLWFVQLFPAFPLFPLLPALFSSDIPLLFALIACYSVFAYPFYCLIIYSIAARLMPGRAPLCVLIAGFSPGRVVRCIMSAFLRGRARI
jgi:hypothetical protein